MSRLVILFSLAVSMAAFFVNPATAADHITFKNNLLPGHLSIHRITRLITRKSPRKDYVENLSYRQVAEWVQCNLNETVPGGIRVIQMMADHPADVVSLFHGAENIRRLPSPEQFNLSRGSTRLHNLTLQMRDASILPPKCDPAQRAILHAILDLAHWPKGKSLAGRRWAHDIDHTGFRGTQSYEFVKLVRLKAGVAAKVKMKLTGRFQGPLEKNHEFVRGRVVFLWARLDRVLLRLDGRIRYNRRRTDGTEEYKMELHEDLSQIDTMDSEKLDGVIDQLTAFAAADNKLRHGRNDEARKLGLRYLVTWPDSLWRPAVVELVKQTALSKQSPRPITTTQLIKRIGKGLIAWETARTQHEYDLLDRTLVVLFQMAHDHRSRLRKLAKNKDDRLRAQAVFVLAFSEQPNDFSHVQRAADRDKSYRVRGMALAGLAARKSPRTNIELLLRRLDDKKALVRARACQAVAACMSREHFSIAKAVEKVTERMTQDDVAAVRLEAIRTLAAIGVSADVPRLENALNYEADKTNREEIKQVIAKLESLKP